MCKLKNKKKTLICLNRLKIVCVNTVLAFIYFQFVFNNKKGMFLNGHINVTFFLNWCCPSLLWSVYHRKYFLYICQCVPCILWLLAQRDNSVYQQKEIVHLHRQEVLWLWSKGSTPSVYYRALCSWLNSCHIPLIKTSCLASPVGSPPGPATSCRNPGQLPLQFKTRLYTATVFKCVFLWPLESNFKAHYKGFSTSNGNNS